jgi:DnaK suppressor protein
MIQQKVEELVSEDFLGHVGQSTVELDQQSVVRPSRMDVLQSQAMAQVQQRRRDSQKMLLLLLCFGWMREFCYCGDCGDAIAEPRLKANPALMPFISRARG